MLTQALLQWRCMFADAVRIQDQATSVYTFSNSDAEVFRVRRKRMNEAGFEVLTLRTPSVVPERKNG